jgi:hypothetical protein
MKRITRLLVVVAFLGALSSPVLAAGSPALTLPAPVSEMTPARWKAFSKNLVVALNTENEGVRIEAMRLAIQYADYVDVKAARFDLMRLYRDHEDDAVRRMAVVALSKSGGGWALGFIERAMRFEQSPCVRQTMAAVVAERNAN